ncbi:hypothetical protein C5167_018834 [Papaver somniferum]|uniref:Uncharacterized protein n=1 Tax=Papaver somniferum TaxID=3469 RepID=A0A4Y7INF6_PAPSO|nr:UPF0481 protein At3g47200-like [Papaver somniferum]RZC50413.1 hypothetical protein C5167_018834 [Papaver somniferum]
MTEMGETLKLEQVGDKNKEIELGEPSKPLQGIDGKKNKKKEKKLVKPSKLVEMIDDLDLERKDFYVELQDPLQIFVIPTYIKRRDQAAYEPKMVSIGPYHYGKAILQPMQFHKERALIHFLRRSPMKASKQQYIDKLMEIVGELRRCYEQVEEITKWQNDEDFVKLMLVDGVFLFEFLNVLRGNQAGRDYADIDPIFGNRGHNLNYNYVMEDLLLLENQIPYKVLSTLLRVSEGVNEEAAKSILSSLMLAPPKYRGHHLLDMYIKGMLGERNDQQPNAGESNVKISASKLSMLGIKFRKVGTYGGIKFERSTKTLSLPSIVINQHTVPRFFNSKAYELRAGTNKELNSYIHLVDFLIQSTDDVSSLRSQGIIVSSLARDEDVVEVMKELTKDTVPGDVDDESTKIVREVTKYYQDKEGKVSTLWIWMADNWASILFAGFILYALTAVQAVYSALSFHYRNTK